MGNQAATINHSFGRLPATFFRNSSLYNGMQVQLTKAMSHGFQATAGFTWQKSIDTASGAVISDSVITAISTLNWFDPKLTRAVSDFNDAKVFTLNYLWDIPTPKSWSGLVRSAVGGWELGGIFLGFLRPAVYPSTCWRCTRLEQHRCVRLSQPRLGTWVRQPG